MRYVIRCHFAKLGMRYAGSQYDWTKPGAGDVLIFDTRSDAQSFKDEFVWEPNACVVPLMEKTRITRASKLTQYHRSVIAHYGNHPDRHNMRYQRQNMHKYIYEKNNSTFMSVVNYNINIRVNGGVITWCKPYREGYMRDLLDSYWRRQAIPGPNLPYPYDHSDCI